MWLLETHNFEKHALEIASGLRVESSAAFVPPTSGSVQRPFIEEHWGAMQMLLNDPDGREVAIEAPLAKKGAEP